MGRSCSILAIAVLFGACTTTATSPAPGASAAVGTSTPTASIAVSVRPSDTTPATSEPTVTPSPEPTPLPGVDTDPVPDLPLAVKITRFTGVVQPGDRASVTAKSAKGAECIIRVYYGDVDPTEDDDATAAALGTKRANKSGVVMWTWTVDPDVASPTADVAVDCVSGERTGEASIVIGIQPAAETPSVTPTVTPTARPTATPAVTPGTTPTATPAT